MKVIHIILEFIILAALLLLIPIIVKFDVQQFETNTETSLTEWVQEIFIFISAVIFAYSAYKSPNFKGLFILIAGLFGTMFIREQNNFLDLISPGFWIYPALVLTLIALILAYKNKKTILNPLIEFSQTKTFVYLFIGLLMVMVFSRTFGTGSLWREVLGEHYKASFKQIIQEGLELLGYAFIAYGSVYYLISKKKMGTT